MTMNEGTLDRLIRIVVGLALGFMSWNLWPADAAYGSVAGAVSLFSLVIGIVAFVTGVVGYCPLYQVFGTRTNSRLQA